LHGILRLDVPSFETRDISALLRVTPANASPLLSRLANRGFVQRLARGQWSMGAQSSREQLAELVAAPSPAYVSLQSALFRHGLIEQIPEVIYAVTLGRALAGLNAFRRKASRSSPRNPRKSVEGLEHAPPRQHNY
jgi:predicted transcriptional regulator of viral defense system